MELYYQRMDTNLFMDYLRYENYAQALAYMIDYCLYDNLEVKPHPHSIEISNSEITIFIILFSGFEKEEYPKSLMRKNVHYVHWNGIIRDMCEFEFFKKQIKIIPLKSLCYTSLCLKEDNRDLSAFLSFLELNPLAVS
ncbi:hypothetical protein [Flavobacterium davisii]|uniref:hypothetical protein n=1 Tax=Flavobacterium davisii TaxID=2906077 RepID=UPI0035D0A187